MNRSRSVALGVVAVAFAVLPAAAEPDPAATESDANGDEPTLRGQGMFYGWIPAMLTGSFTLGQDSASVQANTADLIRHLKFTVGLRGEAWHGQLGLLVDWFYAKLGGERSFEQVGVNTEITQGLGAAALAYRLATWPTSRDPRAMRISADAYAGVRVSRFDVNIHVGPGSHARGETLVDPIIGMRIPLQLSPTWQMAVRGDVGGFGADSDVVWNFEFAFEQNVTPAVGLELGYRIMDIEFSSDAGDTTKQVLMKTLTHGPVLAASYAF